MYILFSGVKKEGWLLGFEFYSCCVKQIMDEGMKTVSVCALAVMWTSVFFFFNYFNVFMLKIILKK